MIAGNEIGLYPPIESAGMYSGIAIHEGKYCKEFQRVLDYANDYQIQVPDKYVLRCVNSTIAEMVNIGLFQARELLYFFGLNDWSNNVSDTGYTENSGIGKFHYINFANPETHFLTRVSNKAPFPIVRRDGFYNESNTGYAGSHYDTGWLQGSATKYSQNDASISWYANIPGGNVVTIGWLNTTNDVKSFFFRAGTGASSLQINVLSGTNTGTGGTWPNALGLYHAERTAANSTVGYFNAGVIRTTATASTANVSTTTLKIGCRTQAASVDFSSSNENFMIALGKSLGLSLLQKEVEVIKNLRAKLGYIN